ncbi:predicted protein [Nematostella vectensis]|uniref:Phospholipid/glycerol acyltransferase domain-containing protein n=1 Tax=Nematostella vectensis TaxID=45351 RepID=A7SJL6_NEMVE|nr:predicted protein [Nematostella vectensis]|eukprot:XP_001628204.1 predicted protein [Nematostella vectensis]
MFSLLFYLHSLRFVVVDWLVADLLAIRQGSLGRIRYILKDGLKFLPLYGFYFGQHGGIYVRRSGPRDHYHIIRKLDQLKKNNTPMWLVIFPEGTRYNIDRPESIEKSKAFAEGEGLPVLQHVLTPRTKATEASLEAVGDYIDAVYDVTIAYKGVTENPLPRTAAKGMPDFLASWGQQVHIYCHRYTPEQIPKNEEDRRTWVHKCFVEKDQILSRFYNELGGGKFPGVPRQRRLSWLRTTPYLAFWLATLAPFIFTKLGRAAYWKMWLVTGFGSVTYMALLFDKLQA